MNRCRTLAAIAVILLLAASQAGGQQPVHRVGVLANNWFPDLKQAWLQGLREHGYVEGQNLQIEYRYFQGRYERVPALLAELVAFDPEIIVTSTRNPAIAIHTTAPSIPLVFLGLGDPVGLGLVESLAHPGGNV